MEVQGGGGGGGRGMRVGGRQIRGILYRGVDESKCVRGPASGLCVSAR